MNNSKRFMWFVVLLAYASLIVAGCAEERDPIDRVQPWALPKSFFVGEDLTDDSDNPSFWSQNSLIDVGYGAGASGLFTSSYAQPLSHIRWFITEDFLMARLAYERIEGTDGFGTDSKVDQGIVVASFRIESHFDIVNSYNPTTGEKMNIVEENMWDRPWYEREFIRVDWSINYNLDDYGFDTLSMLGLYAGVRYEPLAYYVEDPRDPDAPVFDLQNGYFDVTLKAFAAPKTIHLGMWGIDSFPACMLPPDFFGGIDPWGSCSPVELTTRHSFRRVVDSDYTPRDYDGYRFQAYGGFKMGSERKGWTRETGMADDLHRRFLARYNMYGINHYYDDAENRTGPIVCNSPETTVSVKDEDWVDADGNGNWDVCDAKGLEHKFCEKQDPWILDAERDIDGNGTHDECEKVTDLTGLGGSQCDLERHMCTLPLRDRGLTPVVWYYTAGSDPQYFDASGRAANQWDAAMRQALSTGKYVECKRDGGSAKDCRDKYPVLAGQQVDNEALMYLTAEVDDCRHGVAYENLGRNEEDCKKIADSVGTARGYSRDVIELAKMDEHVVFCHSPVQDGDPLLCGNAMPENMTWEDCQDAISLGEDEEIIDTCQSARYVRIGDLRYNQVNGVASPQSGSPWGIMVDAVDPLNGEVVATSVNVWTYVNYMFAQKVVNTMRYIRGELQSWDISEADDVETFNDALKISEGAHGQAAKMDRAELSNMMEGLLGDNLDNIEAHIAKNPELVKDLRAMTTRIRANTRFSSEITSNTLAELHARSNDLKGTQIEADLMTPAMRQLTGTQGMALTDEVMELSSPARGGNPSFAAEMNQMKQNALASRGACILYESDLPFALTGLTDVMEAKFGKFNREDSPTVQLARANKMKEFIADRVHEAVIVHEMGHSMGLRHNFVSSSDAFGYRPQYWQLRTNDKSVTDTCNNLSATGEECIGPRYYDPLTKSEKDNMIHMFMHSSVMDYAGELTQDFMNLGAYDFSYLRMAYGDSMPVFAHDDYKVSSDPEKTKWAQAQGMLNKVVMGFGGITGIQPTYGGYDIHYSEYDNDYKLIQDCSTVTSVDSFIPDRWNTEFDGNFHPTLDAHLVDPDLDGTYTNCKQQEINFVDWDQLRWPTFNEAAVPEDLIRSRGIPSVDPEGRVIVPYGFGTDSWADLGNASVYRHDNGADVYEIFDFMMTSAETDHIWTNYRRGKSTFSLRGARGRMLGRFHLKMRDGAKGLALYRALYKEFSSSGSIASEFESNWRGIVAANYRESMVASTMVFDHFTRILARPQSGPAYFRNDIDGANPFNIQEDFLYSNETNPFGNSVTAVTIPNGPQGLYDTVAMGGRPLENRLSETDGEYRTSYTENCGSYYEKNDVSMLMAESADNFISSSVDDFTDSRYRANAIADLFPVAYRRWLANMLTGDTYLKGPRIAVDASGTPLLDDNGYPKYGLGWTTWWGETPRTCFPAAGTPICGYWGQTETESDAQFKPTEVTNVAVLDPLVEYEQQKFILYNTFMFLAENQRTYWFDLMRLYRIGKDNDPIVANRVEFHNPKGRVYVAQSFGKETIFGKEVQRGISARMIEWANELLEKAYVVTDGPDIDGDGTPDWHLPVMNDGQPLVKLDPNVELSEPIDNCHEADIIEVEGVEVPREADYTGCPCTVNLSCMQLEKYVSLLEWTSALMYHWCMSEKGIYTPGDCALGYSSPDVDL